MSSVLQPSPRPIERRSIVTGCAPASPIVLPITTRDARTASVISASSTFSSSPHRRSSQSSSVGLSNSRPRTSSVLSVVMVPRKETWANISTPESHWHPSGVAGLSFGLPSEGATARRRSSSLICVRGLEAQQQPAVTQPAVQVQPTSAASQPLSPPVMQVPVGCPAPFQATTMQLPGQLPMAYDTGVQPLTTTTSPMFMSNQAVQMPLGGYTQANGGYVYMGMVPMAPMQSVLPVQQQQQAQTIKLSSLISEKSPPTSPIIGSKPTEAITTVMLRNIPQKYDREALIDVLNQTGFAGAFDFFYLPIDFTTTNSVGYAFINFVSEAELARFRAAYVGKKLSEESPKVCEVCDAHLQGKEKNVEFYRNSTVMSMHEKYHPVLYENGARVTFPKPTRPLGPVQRRPPRTHPK